MISNHRLGLIAAIPTMTRSTAARLVALTTLAAFLSALMATSSAADRSLSAAQRQAQIERIRDGLNSPDPGKRLVTLEQAVASKDSTLRRVALSTAFASSDGDLRSVALTAAVGSAATFVVNIAGNDRSNQSEELMKRLGSSIDVRIQDFQRGTDTFQASTAASYDRSTHSQSRSSAVSGERLSFAFDIGRIAPSTVCSGVAILQEGSTTLKGTMNCSGNMTGNFSIVIDILK